MKREVALLEWTDGQDYEDVRLLGRSGDPRIVDAVLDHLRQKLEPAPTPPGPVGPRALRVHRQSPIGPQFPMQGINATMKASQSGASHASACPLTLTGKIPPHTESQICASHLNGGWSAAGI